MVNPRRAGAVAAVLAALVALAGCSALDGLEPAAPTPTATLPVTHGEYYYPSADGNTFGIDGCVPQTAPPSPVVVLVHGGSFTSGSKADLADLCDVFAQQGFAVFSLDYRVVPWGIYPTQVEDVSGAIQWLAAPEQSAALGIDSSRMAVVGFSAGAVISAQTLTAAQPASAVSALRGVVLVSGAYDFRSPRDELGRELESTLLDYLGCTRLSTCAPLDEASPVERDLRALPPVLLVHSADDYVPISQAETFRGALEKAGVDNRLVVVPGSDHADVILRNSPDQVTTVVDFLRSVLVG